ncbi:hypothetical protein H1P_50022 [Hyella patelloides LEGE 07179]|uniref:Uncharacterized protein n=1 Tax=Hyella patelloides LEGE 07179 TaxID=945734 RepID=A0A563VZM1_9CYAN|nr:hypothetical protein [Hyella patelloides]VEP16817.1 hypothetical protein H1P_50022 [Hyella patelloides LEGE 07179]
MTVLILNDFHPRFQSQKISGEISGAVTTVLTLVVSYLVPPSRKETTVIEAGAIKSAKT